MISKEKLPKNVKVGSEGFIDNNVVLGVMPANTKDTLTLEIGKNCYIRSGTVIYAGTKIGDNFQTGHGATIRERCLIGNNVSIGTNAVVERDTIIKDNVRIHSGAFIPEYAFLDEGAWIGPNVVLTNAPYPTSPYAKSHMMGPKIGKYAKVGANSTILPYVFVGENSIVGAGSVVVSDVPRNSVVVGNPARKIKTVHDLKIPGGLHAYPELLSANISSPPKLQIPRSYPFIDGEERRAVLEVLASRQFVKGQKVRLLEEEFAKYCGVKYAIGVNSGTSALLISLMAIGIKGKEVITPSNSFLASANAIELAGGKAVFVEPDPKTFTIDVEKIREKITDKTAAIMPVHLYGQPADMDKINSLAKEYSLTVIEDACQAHGALYKRKKTGSLGEVGCFSFYPTKNMMCAGDGGIITTNNEDIAKCAIMLRDAGREGNNPDNCSIFGFNMRLGEIQAVVALAQLKRLDSWNEKRRTFAKIYTEELSSLVDTPYEADYAYHIYHLYTIKTKKRDKLKNFLKERGIETSVSYSIPLPLTDAYAKKYGYRKGDFQVTEKLCSEILSLPMFPQLSEEEVRLVCSSIKDFFRDEV